MKRVLGATILTIALSLAMIQSISAHGGSPSPTQSADPTSIPSATLTPTSTPDVSQSPTPTNTPPTSPTPSVTPPPSTTPSQPVVTPTPEVTPTPIPTPNSSPRPTPPPSDTAATESSTFGGTLLWAVFWMLIGASIYVLVKYVNGRVNANRVSK